MMRRILVGTVLLGMQFGVVYAATPAVEAAVLKSLRGAVAYSHKANYSEAIPDMYLAYDKEGKVVAGAAVRAFKTYADVTSLLVVRRQGTTCVAETADIPDVQVIQDAGKRQRVTDAVKSMAGKVLRDHNGNLVTVDAVSGATKYQARIYANFNMMAAKIIEAMEANPAWEKKPLK